MGSKKTYVGTSVSRVIADEQVTSAIKSGTVTSILNNKDIMDEITDSLVHSIATSGNAYYNYGKNNYALPLPSGYPTDALDTHGAVEVEAVIQDEIEMAEVAMGYCFFGNLNYLHILMETITNTYAYDITTNELDTLSTLKGYPVYLTQVTLIGPTVLIDALSDDSLKILDGMVYVRINEMATTIGAELKYRWETPPVFPATLPTVHVETVSLGADVTPVWFDVAADYFHARYVIGGVTKYFTYEKEEGTYPTLDDLFDASTGAGSYYPWIHLRNNYTAIDVDPSTAECVSATKLMNKLGIDLSAMSTSLSENPAIGDVIQAVFMLGIPPETTNPVEQEYLYRYFDAMFLGLGGETTELSATDLVASLTHTDLVNNSIVIQDSKLKTKLLNSGIYRRLVTGALGKVGTYSSSSGAFTIAIPRYTEDGGSSPLYYNRSIEYVLYKKQVSNTQYEEIQVIDLSCSYHVIGRYYTTGNTDDETNIILIPLDMSIVSQLSLIKREPLYARAMHIVFNSVQIVKLEWYQTGIFKAFLFIVAFVVIVLSKGTLAKEMLALIAGEITLYGVIILLLDLAGVAFYSYAFKELVKAIGIENAFILLLVLSLKNLYTIFNAETVKAGLVSAEYFMKLATGLMQGIQTMTTELTEDIAGELDALNKEMESAFGELDRLRKEMDSSKILKPFMLLGETPDEYYNRTVHSGNPGVKVYETVSKYVKTMLTLPEFDGFFESKEHGIS